MSFSNYKNKSLRNNLQESVKKKIQEDNQVTGFEVDPDDWYPGVDKAGNGLAQIRFLPPLESDPDLSYVKWISHSFKDKNTGRWYIENSLKRFKSDKNPDPVGDFNKKLWNSSSDKEDAAHKQARDQKQKLNCRANIYVISDAINPENNGKIKKFKFGKFIDDMIIAAIEPKDTLDKEEALPVFDLFDGANLKISIFSEIRGGKAQRNYSRSKWMERGPLTTDEKLLESIYNELNSNPKWSLKQYIQPSCFKSYDELKKRLDFVIGYDTATGKSLDKPNLTLPETNVVSQPQTNPTHTGTSDDEFFKQLAEDSDDEDSIF